MSIETKAKISAKFFGNKHPLFGVSPSEETKLKMIGSQPTKIDLEITDSQTNKVTTYTTMREAAIDIGCGSGTFSNYFYQSKNGKPYRGRYIIRKL